MLLSFDISFVYFWSTKGENSKAAEARSRKAAAQAEVAQKKQQAIEDEYWRDDDKHVAKKQQRKVTHPSVAPEHTTLYHCVPVEALYHTLYHTRYTLNKPQSSTNVLSM